MKRKVLSLLVILSFVFMLFGCSNNTEGKYEITDCAGYTYHFDEKVDTVACVWPSGGQLLISMGMGDVLIGVPNNTKEQPWAHALYPNLSEIQGLDQYESAESLLSLDADIVLTSESNVAEELRSKGVRAITFCYYSVDEMKFAMNMMADLLDKKYAKKFSDYVEYLEDNIQMVNKALDGKIEEKKSIYYINGNKDNGLYKTAGGQTMNEAWANLAYCDFATSSLLASNETKVDKEAILSKNPDVVIIGGRYQHKLENDIKNAEEWKDIKAVKNNEIYTAPLGVSPFDRFGIEIAVMIPWVASVAYGEYFTYDINNEIINFYNKFAGIKLSEEQAQYIVEGRLPNGEFEIQ